jgi:DNA-binding response OmpR family regulator
MPLVLVVDDQRELLDCNALAFTLAGWAVLSAESADVAVALAECQWPDVVLADLAMPGGDGLELAAKLRRLAPERPLPVIIVTGQPALLRERGRELASLAVCRVLTKPVGPDQLVEVAGRVLRACGQDCRGPRSLVGPETEELSLAGCGLHF